MNVTWYLTDTHHPFHSILRYELHSTVCPQITSMLTNCREDIISKEKLLGMHIRYCAQSLTTSIFSVRPFTLPHSMCICHRLYIDVTFVIVCKCCYDILSCTLITLQYRTGMPFVSQVWLMHQPYRQHVADGAILHLNILYWRLIFVPYFWIYCVGT